MSHHKIEIVNRSFGEVDKPNFLIFDHITLIPKMNFSAVLKSVNFQETKIEVKIYFLSIHL